MRLRSIHKWVWEHPGDAKFLIFVLWLLVFWGCAAFWLVVLGEK